ncbi:MAG: hypothetical protein ABEH81_09575 [Halopenitus sp.]
MSSQLEPRIRQLATEAREIRESTAANGSDGSDDDADVDLDLSPLAAARDGLGPVLAVYVEARAGDEAVRFDQAELDLLHRATNDWLVVYARQRGVDADPDATVREAAELLLDTHDVVDVAATLVGLPAE